MFIFKKIISQFFFPMQLCLGLSFIGLFLLWFTRKQRAGKALVSIGLISMTLLSYGAVSGYLLEPFETRYTPYNKVNTSTNGYRIKYVVVLGGGHISDPNLPITSQINGASLVRLVEGIRIYRKHTGCKLILSGGSGFDPIPNADIMAQVAKEIGVVEKDIILERKSRDTRDEARILKSVVGRDPFVLVTSASHMSRAMGMFKKFGMNPVPAPTGHRIRKRQGLSPESFFPGITSLGNARTAIKESLGLIWAKLSRQI